MTMSSGELRKKFLEFFSAKEHKIAPSSSLIPDDPSVLLTTAGMQQFKKYYTEPSLAPAKNIASIQKCFRTSDIDEVGDESHLTFFEMLGNFSFGGYFKVEAIKLAKEFLESIGLKIDYVTVFGGDKEIPLDKESEEIWRTLGIKDIRKAGREDNFWGPTGNEGPCGPTAEIYINGVEIWNLVFNEYYCDPISKLSPLTSKGVDTGMGLERLAMVSQNKKNIFETDLFEPIWRLLPARLADTTRRIIADHARGIAFLISDGVRPSNKEAGYVLRRLIRRIVVYKVENIESVFKTIVENYSDFYPELDQAAILSVFKEEREKFDETVYRGLEKMETLSEIDAASAFMLYESYGLPFEIIKEIGQKKAENLTREDFNKELERHKEISRAGAEKKFGGHGLILNTGELKAANEEEANKVTRLHTATHLLQAALRKILGESVRQVGSDITAERARFDFTFERKLTDDELKKVEDTVNFAIKQKYDVQKNEMPYEDAIKLGALHVFSARGGEKYPPKVNVYSVGNFDADTPEIFSRELCGGPHVKNASEIGHFKILKQEPLGSGLRRIRATVE